MAFSVLLRHIFTVAFCGLQFAVYPISFAIAEDGKSKSGEADACYLFAYGSNMLTSRLRMVVPEAEFFGIGKVVSMQDCDLPLNDYQLDFDHKSDNWKGCVATCVSREVDTCDGSNEHGVWGVVWLIQTSDIDALDTQGGVSKGIYKRTQVKILVEDTEVPCITYVLQVEPVFSCPLPEDRYPSALYMKTLIAGAEEHELPPQYIEYLTNLPNNGQGENDEIKKTMLN